MGRESSSLLAVARHRWAMLTRMAPAASVQPLVRAALLVNELPTLSTAKKFGVLVAAKVGRRRVDGASHGDVNYK